jgi:two-component system sensor histidine kinase KdpD
MKEDYRRPDPDELLNSLKEEEDKREMDRGYLKIFLGYVAGVGKTYRMLSEAQALKEKQKDIVVGIVETHGRAETEELLESMEIIPRLRIDYRGIVLEELDIDAVLERKPSYVLVDELAHTNAPGSRHTKRCQDVEELLNAGINVYSTLNIQHIESINDIVQQITGVEVKETVPDRIIELADKIEVVDLPIEELIERLNEGKVYVPERAKKAMSNFFTEKNLIALRETTLRYATRHVDYEMGHYLKKEKIMGPWDTSNRIMACISSSPSSRKIIRIAHRFSHLYNVEWFAVYVEPYADLRMTDESRRQLEKNLELAEELDGKTIRLKGSIANEIVSFASSKNITLILLGHSRRSRLQELLEGSVINKVIQKTAAQVLIVENKREFNIDTENPKITKDGNQQSFWESYAMSFSTIGFTTVICLMLRPFIEAVNIPMIFIIPVIFTGLISGKKAGILASLLAVASFDFFFVPPFYTFNVADVRFIPTFLVLLLVGIITSLLADTVKKQVEYTRQRETFISSLHDFTKGLLVLQDLPSILERITRYVSESFNYDVVILLPDENRKLNVVSSSVDKESFDDHETAVSSWAFEHDKAAGFGTETLSSSRWYHVPLKVHDGILGIMSIDSHNSMNSEQRNLIDSFANVVSLALLNALNRNMRNG